MPKIFDQNTLVIQTGGGSAAVAWGPDFGDASDDNSFTSTGLIVVDNLTLDGNLTAVGEFILSAILNGTLDLTAINEARIENLNFVFTGPWTATGSVNGDLVIDFSLLTTAGLVERDISTIYDLLTSQQTVVADTFSASYTGPWTSLGTITGDLSAEYTGPWTTTGTIAYDIGPSYSTLTSQQSIVADTLALDHTRTCSGSMTGALSYDPATARTCQTSIGQLNYLLDFVGAAVDTDINLTIPPGCTLMTCEIWSGGGGGGSALVNGGGGGGGGGYARRLDETIVPGETLTIKVGSGGAAGVAGGESYIQENGVNRARATGGGAGGNGGAGGQGVGGARGDATVGSTIRDGGLGGGNGGVQLNGGGGGGGSGTDNAGGSGAANRTAGTGGAQFGGDGGIGGGGVGAPSAAGSLHGGGGGGASTTNGASGGQKGKALLDLSIPTP